MSIYEEIGGADALTAVEHIAADGSQRRFRLAEAGEWA